MSSDAHRFSIETFISDISLRWPSDRRWGVAADGFMGEGMFSKSIWLACRLAAAAAIIGSLGACATIVSGTSQDIAVSTEPAGAACQLERSGIVIGTVNPTPGTIKVERNKNDMVLICKKDGYEDGKTPLISSFNGTTFGNFLLGGWVGVAIDASSGANNKYPETAYVILTPGRFSTATARDEHFARIKDKITAGALEATNKIKAECAAERKEQCNIDIKKIEDERDRQLADVEARRQSARVAS
jgi:hypothetical protein